MIPLLNPAKSNLPYINELLEASERVIRGGQYILGREVEEFEEAYASYLDVKHAIGVSSGTDALIASLIALGIGSGDEVICPSFTFFATAGAIVRVGATPVFVDVTPDSFTIDPEKIEEAITDKTRAILPVYLFGQAADMDRIMEIAETHNLYVIEDACQSIGARLNDKYLGSIGDVGAFSFFPSKNLGGFGDAGLVTTNSDFLATRIKQTRNHGMTAPYQHSFVGGNFRIDALQAALLKVKLKYLDEAMKTRLENVRCYEDKLDLNQIILPKAIREKHVWNQYTIQVPDVRDGLKDYLTKQEIASAIYYPIPLHQQPCFDYLPTVSLSITETLCKNVLSIPIAPEVGRDNISFVAEKIDKFFK